MGERVISGSSRLVLPGRNELMAWLNPSTLIHAVGDWRVSRQWERYKADRDLYRKSEIHDVLRAVLTDRPFLKTLPGEGESDPPTIWQQDRFDMRHPQFKVHARWGSRRIDDPRTINWGELGEVETFNQLLIIPDGRRRTVELRAGRTTTLTLRSCADFDTMLCLLRECRDDPALMFTPHNALENGTDSTDPYWEGIPRPHF